MSNSCIGDNINPPKNLDTAKGASPRSTSKSKKHPLAKAPFRQAGIHQLIRCFPLEPFLKSIRVFSVVGLAVNSD